MELLLAVSDSKPIVSENHLNSFKPGGVLNSEYQSIVKLTQDMSSATSLYRIKQSIKTKRYYLVSNAETLLKLTVFAAVILSVFN